MTTTIRSNADGSKSYIQVGGTDRVTIGSQGIEAGSYAPGSIVANDFADGALIENSVNGIGYGTGSGGTVTQATSKSTAVTLNKPCGQITMNAASLPAGGSIAFTLNNSLITDKDTLVVTIGDLVVVSPSYEIHCSRAITGGARIQLKNVSAGALAESVVVNFALIKGATS